MKTACLKEMKKIEVVEQDNVDDVQLENNSIRPNDIYRNYISQFREQIAEQTWTARVDHEFEFECGLLFTLRTLLGVSFH